MKRFTETNKWNDPWFRKLSPQAKHLLNYLRDKCDSAGVVEVDLDAVSFHVGEPIKEQHLAELESRLQHLPSGKVVMPKFVSFQYGAISEACPAHKPILKLISFHGLKRVGLEYRYPTATLALPQETSTKIPISIPSDRVQEKEKEKEKEEEGVQGEKAHTNHYHPHSRVAIHWLNEKSNRHFRETDPNLSVISARLREPGVDLEGIKQMIERQCKRWLGTSQAEYLRPETLFGKTKFDSYYAAKDLPIGQAPEPVNPRNPTGRCT